MTDNHSPPPGFTLDVCMICGGESQGIHDMGYSCAGGVCSGCFETGLAVTECALCGVTLPMFYYHTPGKARTCRKCRVKECIPN